MAAGRRSTAVKHESALREMTAARWSKARMGRVLGVHQHTISAALKMLGIHHGGMCWSERKFDTHAIPAFLRDERMKQGMTIDDLAKKSGYNRSLISEMERGRIRMHLPGSLVDIAQALGYEFIPRRIG